MTVKSPPSALAPSGVKAKAKAKPRATPTGRRFLENGEPYIYWWPTSRKPLDMNTCEGQCIEEAARWASEALLYGKG